MDDTNKRLLIAFGLTVAVWLVFDRFFLPGAPPSAPGKPAPAASTGGGVPEPGGAGEKVRPAAGSAAAPEQTPVVDGARWRATLTTRGGGLRGFALKHPRYVEERGGRTMPVDLVQVAADPFPFEVDFGPALRPDAPWIPQQVGAEAWQFAREDAHARIVKTFRFDHRSHVARMHLRAENRGSAGVQERMVVRVTGRQDPKAPKPGMLNPSPRVWTATCHVNGSVEQAARDQLDADRPHLGDVRWAGIADKYFLMAAAPVGEKSDVRCVLRGGPDGRIETAMEMSTREVPPGGAVEREFLLYLGPKALEDLDAVEAGGRSLELGDSVNYGWLEILCRPMVWLLKRFQAWVGNWGVAIVLLTILVKLATLYWTQKSMRSMKGMAKVAPEIKRLQEKYKRPEDKDRLNQEVMNLYKRHGVNPLGGCLPMLLQMPIWIALYRTLSESVELYRSSLGLWIHDLALPDRYFVLPALLGLLSLGQTWMQARVTPQTDPNQKMMMWMMPIMFVVFSLFVPAGLTLYWLVNTVLTMIHQWLMNRADVKAAPAKA